MNEQVLIKNDGEGIPEENSIDEGKVESRAGRAFPSRLISAAGLRVNCVLTRESGNAASQLVYYLLAS